jgi:hypothetical protein
VNIGSQRPSQGKNTDHLRSILRRKYEAPLYNPAEVRSALYYFK